MFIEAIGLRSANDFPARNPSKFEVHYKTSKKDKEWKYLIGASLKDNRVEADNLFEHPWHIKQFGISR